MPLTEQDVLDTLDNSALGWINFSLGGVLHVGRRKYSVIREHIVAGNIAVKPWDKSYAQYSPGEDPPMLYMQDDTSPASLDARALLLHECTHAVGHVFAVKFGVLDEEVTCYLAQVAYQLVVNPHFTTAPNNPPWFKFFDDCLALVKARSLHRGGYQLVTFKEVEDLKNQLPNLPGDLYTGKDALSTVGTGLRNVRPFMPVHETVPETYKVAAMESYPEPSDDYLAELLGRRYAKNDVAGYGGRVRELEQAFQRVSKGKALGLYSRLAARIPGDKVSMFFHDHLSTATRAKMLAILKSRAAK